MKRTTTIFLVSALAAGIAGAAYAGGYGRGGCDGYGPGAAMPGQGGPDSGAAMMQQGQGAPGYGRHGGRMNPEAMAGRFEKFHDRLGITPEQEPAWTAFTTKVTARMEAMQGHRARMKAARQEGASAVERADQHVAMMGEGLAAMTEMADAVKSLYAELTPEQQQQFDRLPIGGRMGRHRPF